MTTSEETRAILSMVHGGRLLFSGQPLRRAAVAIGLPHPAPLAIPAR